MKFAAPCFEKLDIHQVLQLGCMAASPAAMRAAIGSGADWVRVPFRLAETPLEYLKRSGLRKAIRYVHAHQRKLVLDLSHWRDISTWRERQKSIAWLNDEGIDAVILASPSLALYCAIHHPHLPIHFVAQASICARTALQLQRQLGLARILVPHSSSLSQLIEMAIGTNLELEIVRFDAASSFALQDFSAVDASDRTAACNDACYSHGRFEQDIMARLPLLAAIGIRAIQIEPRADTPDEVTKSTRTWRTAIDKCLVDIPPF